MLGIASETLKEWDGQASLADNWQPRSRGPFLVLQWWVWAVVCGTDPRHLQVILPRPLNDVIGHRRPGDVPADRALLKSWCWRWLVALDEAECFLEEVVGSETACPGAIAIAQDGLEFVRLMRGDVICSMMQADQEVAAAWAEVCPEGAANLLEGMTK